MKARPRDPLLRIGLCLLLMPTFLAGCSSSARQLLDQAESSWRKGRYPEAIQENEDLYKLEPRGSYAARALLNIGNIYYLNLRKLKEAIEAYDKLVREFPDSIESLQARRQMAAIYANEVVDLDQAIAQYNRLLEAKDLADRSEILFQRADAFFKKGDYDRALRELSNLEESGISDHLAAQVSLKIGNIYQIKRTFDKAIEPLRKALAARCADCAESRRRAILSLAETYEALFDFDKAMDTIRKLDKTPENEQFISSEVERLNKKRKDVDKNIGLNWDQPRVSQGATKAPTPAKKLSPGKKP